MKDFNELGKDLAKLYGIEIVEKPNQYIVIIDSVKVPFTGSNIFLDVFGLENLENNLNKNV